MTRVDWRSVPEAGFPVPDAGSLPDLTAELTGLLGDPDPALRVDTALAVLTTWIDRGVYDDLLIGLGDGIATGLTSASADGVFRRVSSAIVLGRCIARDSARPLVPQTKVLDWGDRVATWLLAERDLREHVEGRGWVRAIPAGADALGELASSRHLGRAELAAILDVIGERVLAPVEAPWAGIEADRLARAAIRIIRRDAVPLDDVEEWAARIGKRAAVLRRPLPAPDPVATNAAAFLRSLYLVLALGPQPPRIRADLVLTLVNFLRELHPDLLA